MVSGSKQVILRSAYTHTNSYPAEPKFVLSVQKGTKYFSHTHFNHTDYTKYIQTYSKAISHWTIYKYKYTLAICLHVKGKFNTMNINFKTKKKKTHANLVHQSNTFYCITSAFIEILHTMIYSHQWNKTVHTGNVLGLPICALTCYS